MPTETDQECINFVFDMGMDKIKHQFEAWNAIDGKTGVVLGFLVVSVAEILGFLLLAAAEDLKYPSFSAGVVIFFFLGLASVLLATICGLLALRPRDFMAGYDFLKMVPNANQSKKTLQEMFLEDLLTSVEKNTAQLEKKRKYMARAALCTAAGLMLYIVVIALIFWKFIPEGVLKLLLNTIDS